MGLFYDIGKKTSETTSKMAKEAKLKFKMNENKDKISDLYEEIGKKVYEKHVREENIDIKSELKLESEKIDELAKEIEEARREMLILNRKKQCSKCNSEMSDESKFCPKCGEKQHEEEATVFEEAIEKLEKVEIKSENEVEAQIVKEKLEENINQDD